MTVPNHTILPPAGRQASATTSVNGRAYTGVAAGSVFSSVPDGDARKLAASGFILAAPGGSGTTAQRPTTAPDGRAIRPGTLYLDMTLGYIVVWDGATWRRPNTGAAV